MPFDRFLSGQLVFTGGLAYSRLQLLPCLANPVYLPAQCLADTNGPHFAELLRAAFVVLQHICDRSSVQLAAGVIFAARYGHYYATKLISPSN